MKKRTLRLAPLVLTLFIALSACGGGATATPFDPEAASKALLDSAAFSDALDSVSTSAICAAYGIDESTVTGCAAYLSLSAGAEEISVFTLTDKAAATTALESLNKRVTDQTEALKSYQPEEVAKLEKAIVLQRENSILLVVAADAAAAQTVIDGL